MVDELVDIHVPHEVVHVTHPGQELECSTLSHRSHLIGSLEPTLASLSCLLDLYLDLSELLHIYELWAYVVVEVTILIAQVAEPLVLAIQEVLPVVSSVLDDFDCGHYSHLDDGIDSQHV